MKKIIRSVFAVLAGSITISLTAIGSAFLLGMLVPAAFQNDGKMPGTGILLFMLAYSVLFAALGGFVTAWLSASAPMAHVLVLAILQLVSGLALTMMQMGSAVPQWFQLLMAMLPVPVILLGGKLYRTKRTD